VQGAARAGSGAGAGCASAYDLPATARREVKWAEGVDVEWAIHPQSTRLPSTSGVKLATQPCGTRQAGPLRAGAHLRQIILSWLNLRARICSDGSMMPPRRRSTRWSVDSAARATPASDKGALLARPGAQTAAEIVALQPPRGRPTDGAHPSGCCSLPASGHPRAACRRKSGAAGRAGCLRAHRLSTR